VNEHLIAINLLLSSRHVFELYTHRKLSAVYILSFIRGNPPIILVESYTDIHKWVLHSAESAV